MENSEKFTGLVGSIGPTSCPRRGTNNFPYKNCQLPVRLPTFLDEASASYGGKITHELTTTRWTPTNSVGVGSSSSRQSSIASLTLYISTSSDFSCVWHPSSVGTEATKYPSSSFSITTLNSLFISITLHGLKRITEAELLHLSFEAND